MATALELTQELIRIPSITPRDEGCMDIIIPRLKALGFSIELFRYGEAINLYARLGTEKPLLCFVGHTDVVAPGDLRRWKFPPFDPTISDGYLYGRGAADMKCGDAAFIVALEELLFGGKKLKGSISLLISSSEEGNSALGTPNVIEVLEKRQEKIDFCIVGEASSSEKLGDVIKNGRKGIANCEFDFRYSPEVTFEQLQERTEQLLMKHCLNYEIKWEHTGFPFFTKESQFTKACEKAVKEVTGITPKFTTGGGTSDGRFVAPTGAEVIEFGVVNKTIHKINECTRVEEIETLKNCYVKMLTLFPI